MMPPRFDAIQAGHIILQANHAYRAGADWQRYNAELAPLGIELYEQGELLYVRRIGDVAQDIQRHIQQDMD